MPPGAARVPPTTAQALLRMQPAMRHFKPLAWPPYQRLLFNFIDFNNMHKNEILMQTFAELPRTLFLTHWQFDNNIKQLYKIPKQ